MELDECNPSHVPSTCVTKEQNTNLSTSQKELTCWHYWLCHEGLSSLKWLMKTGALGDIPLMHAASKCDLPKFQHVSLKRPHKEPLKVHNTYL